MNASIQLPLRHSVLLLTLISSSLLFAATAPDTLESDMPRRTRAAESNPAAHRDRVFIETAARSGQKEVAISQEVLTRLTDVRVRDFAQMMVSDHTAANSRLTELAIRKAIITAGPPDAVDGKWSIPAKGLDEEYLKVMIKEHEAAADLFEKAEKSADPDVAAFAQSTLPTIQRHLAVARELEKSLH